MSPFILRPDGCIANDAIVVEPWPSLRMRPSRCLLQVQEILSAKRGDPIWPFSAKIPPRLRHLARMAPGHSWELLELAAAAPERGCELVRQCPALALLLVRTSASHGGSLHEYYGRVLDLTWRQILGTVGLPAERRFVRILRKIPIEHCDDETLGALATAITQRHAHLRIVGHLPRITADTVALLTLPPSLVNSRLLLQSGTSRIGELRAFWCVQTVSCLRELEGPGRDWPYRGLDFQTLLQVEHRLRTSLVDGDPLSPFPTPPIAGVPGVITPLENYWALQSEGNDQQNCAALFLAEVLAGESYLYAVRICGERATLLLRRLGCGDRWVYADLKARFNRPVSAAIKRCVSNWLNGRL